MNGDTGRLTSFSTHLSRFISLIRMVDLPVNPPLTIYFFTNMHAVTKNPGCRTPIRQMPSGILLVKDCDIIGKSEFANPLSDFYLCKMG